MKQAELFDSLPSSLVGAPAGFRHVPDFISADEETALIGFVTSLEYRPFVLMGQASRRLMSVYGYQYTSEADVNNDVGPIPDALIPRRDRCARELVNASPERFLQAVVTHYPSGAGINWHQDYAVYGPTVLGVSLGAPCRFRLRRTRAPDETFAIEMAPRSAYVMSDASRSAWQHAITPVKQPRWSITFRTVRNAR